MNKPDFTFPIQSANQHKQKFSKEDPVNADLLAKREALAKLCKKYNTLITYLTKLAEDETASHSDRYKAVSKLLDLQDKLAKQLAEDEEKVKNVKAASEAEENPEGVEMPQGQPKTNEDLKAIMRAKLEAQKAASIANNQ